MMGTIPVEAYERAAQMLSYDADTGHLVYASNIRDRWIGERVGTVYRNGYVGVRTCGHVFQAHRLIWFMAHRELPAHIDHINGVKADNRLCNLRAATAAENAWNRSLKSNSRTGFMGVTKNRSGRFVASITVNKKHVNLGSFDAAEDAARAYEKACKTYHGEFASPDIARVQFEEEATP